MSRGTACGPPFGMGLDVESSGAGWVSLVFGSSLRWLRVVVGSRPGYNIEHMYFYVKGVMSLLYVNGIS